MMPASRTMEFNLANLGPNVRSFLLQGDQVDAQPTRIDWAYNVLESSGIIRRRAGSTTGAVPAPLVPKPAAAAIVDVAANSKANANDNNDTIAVNDDTVADSRYFPAFNATMPFK